MYLFKSKNNRGNFNENQLRNSIANSLKNVKKAALISSKFYFLG